MKDLNRSEQILREGFSIAEVRDRAELARRLADLYEGQGRNQEAAEFRQQAKAEVTREAGQDTHSCGPVLRQKTKIEFGGAGLPLRELSNVAAMLRGRSASTPTPASASTSAPAPVTTQKIGRNESCPCGSGKKFKRCCGGI
jgi:preprotein translocase subunit SecA